MPIPTPGTSQVLVRIRYAGVNASDVNITSGIYFQTTDPPYDLDIEAAGHVVAIGPGVTQFKEGDPVLTLMIGGGYREYLAVDVESVFSVPAETLEYLALSCSGLPASIGLNVTGEMKKDQTILVTAAAGGNGQFAVQLARNHMIGTCGSDAKVDLLKRLGCHRVIQHRREDVAAVLQREYPQGVDIVYENVGGPLFDACVDALATHGRLVVSGYISEYISGPQEVTSKRIYEKLFWKSRSIRACFIPDFFPIWREHLAGLVELHTSGKIQSIIDPKPFHGLESVADAVEYLHAGQSAGKVVVRITD